MSTRHIELVKLYLKIEPHIPIKYVNLRNELRENMIIYLDEVLVEQPSSFEVAFAKEIKNHDLSIFDEINARIEKSKYESNDIDLTFINILIKYIPMLFVYAPNDSDELKLLHTFCRTYLLLTKFVSVRLNNIQQDDELKIFCRLPVIKIKRILINGKKFAYACIDGTKFSQINVVIRIFEMTDDSNFDNILFDKKVYWDPVAKKVVLI
jgi:hypothetical protein